MVGERWFSEVDQIGWVVRDLQRSMAHYWEKLGMGPWKVYVFEEPMVWDMSIRGRPAKYRMILAMYPLGNMVLELIQPLEGETTYKEFLERQGEGIHHLGIFVSDVDEEVERFRKMGIGTLQSGKYQGGGYAYLDTQEQFGTIFELIQRSKPPLTPIRIWPENYGK